MGLETDGLRLFILAAEKLNISAAGRDLGFAPAVSSAKLAKLEQSIGADLLHRSTRKVSLSLEGSEFLPYAREIVAQEDAARAVLGQRDAEATGTLRFTAPSTFSQLYIAPILPEFFKAHPNVKLDLRLSDIRLNLIEGSFDLALRNAVLCDSSMKGRKLADDTRILCASPAYLEVFGTPATPDDLKKHHLIGFQDASPRELVSQSGERGIFDPQSASNRLVVDDGMALKLTTLAGSGISSNSLWSVARDLAEGNLVRVLPDYRMAEETVLWLMYPHTNVLSAKVKVFMDFLLKHIGRNPPWQATSS